MKIISKHKEFYDYLQGIYGIDEKVIYDRRTENLVKPNIYTMNECYEYIFAICNKLFVLYNYKNKFYHTVEEIVELDDLLRKDNKVPIIAIGYKKSSNDNKLEAAISLYERTNLITNVNKITRQPVLIKCDFFGSGEFKAPIEVNNGSYYGKQYSKHDASWSIPLLTDFGIASYYPAEKIYQDIVAFIGWLVDNPPLPDTQTNEGKILSHGFDLKESFRHRK